MLKSKLHNITYRKIPLLSPGCVYGQKKNLMDLCSKGRGVGRGGGGGGGWGGLYLGGKTLQT